MNSMFYSDTQRIMAERLARLAPDSTPQWGSMTAPKMVAHLTQSFRSAIGELKVAPRFLPLHYLPFKQVVIFWFPMPKDAPTAPELLTLEPTDWEPDVARLQDLMRRFAAKRPDSEWPEHGAFGRLTGVQWGVLMYRHADHHFRQFGV
jgi:hypothetical protein